MVNHVSVHGRDNESLNIITPYLASLTRDTSSQVECVNNYMVSLTPLKVLLVPDLLMILPVIPGLGV